MKIIKDGKIITSEALNSEIILNENNRKANEINRDTSEHVRISQETNRQTTYNNFNDAEGVRVVNENTRKSSEITRNDSEVIRISQEINRQSNYSSSLIKFKGVVTGKTSLPSSSNLLGDTYQVINDATTSNNAMWRYNGTVFEKAYVLDLTFAGGYGANDSQVFTATANQTLFTLTEFPYLVGVNQLLVMIGGVKQTLGSAYTETSTNSFTLSEGVPVGTKVEAFRSVPGGAGSITTQEVENARVSSLGIGYANLKARLDDHDSNKVGVLANLNTSVKTDIVSSVNEVNTARLSAQADYATSVESFPVQLPEADDTARIQRAVNACVAKGTLLFRWGKLYTVSNFITVKSELTIFGYSSSIQQVTDNTEIFKGVSISDFLVKGLEFIGVGTDYTKVSGNLARGINITGTIDNFSKNIVVEDCTFIDFSHAGIALMYTEGFELNKNVIVGTALTKGNVVEFDNWQFGIWLGSWNYNGKIDGNDVSQTAQGIFNGYNAYNLDYTKNHVHDIAGQHGFYLSHGINLTVINNIVEDCANNGIKFQQADTSTEISQHIQIMFNKVRRCGLDGIILLQAGTVRPFHVYDAQVMFNQVSNCGSSGISAYYLHDSFIGFNAVINDASYIVDVTRGKYGIRADANINTDIQNNQTINTNWTGIYIGSSNSLMKLSSNKVYEPGQAQVSNNNYGIYIETLNDDITVEDNLVKDANLKMLYSFFMNTATNVKVKHNKFLDVACRIYTGALPIEWEDNKVVSIIGYPAAITKGRKATVYHGTVANAPASATGYVNGDRYEYTDPLAGGFMGKILVGGAWKTYGEISA